MYPCYHGNNILYTNLLLIMHIEYFYHACNLSTFWRFCASWLPPTPCCHATRLAPIHATGSISRYGWPLGLNIERLGTNLEPLLLLDDLQDRLRIVENHKRKVLWVHPDFHDNTKLRKHFLQVCLRGSRGQPPYEDLAGIGHVTSTLNFPGYRVFDLCPIHSSSLAPLF